MTQTASISSLNKKKFLKKAFKGLGANAAKEVKSSSNPPFPTPENKNEENADY